jgi:hypothetical protein
MTIAIQLKDRASLVKGNYIASLLNARAANGDPPHYDGVTLFAGGPAEICYNTMDIPPGTAALFVAHRWGQDIFDVWCHHNLMYGEPSYTIYSEGHPPNVIRNFIIEDNYIERGGYGYILIQNSQPTVRNNVQWQQGVDPTPPPPAWAGTYPWLSTPPAPPPSPTTEVTFFPNAPSPTPTNFAEAMQLELGMRFKSSVAGKVNGIRFWKGSGETGTHSVTLWSSTGQQLATGTTSNETAGGWQTVRFGTPILIAANTIYTVSYHSNGKYGATKSYFAQAKTNGSLTAPVNAGVFVASNSRAFPTQTYMGNNYWVDVLFSP